MLFCVEVKVSHIKEISEIERGKRKLRRTPGYKRKQATGGLKRNS
jgi:hypothetical protein